jgi:hypothetical protein
MWGRPLTVAKQILANASQKFSGPAKAKLTNRAAINPPAKPPRGLNSANQKDSVRPLSGNAW